MAALHGNVEKAIEILASSKKERLRLMSTAVAGYLAYKRALTLIVHGKTSAL